MTPPAVFSIPPDRITPLVVRRFSLAEVAVVAGLALRLLPAGLSASDARPQPAEAAE